jgi:hypothetical protein
MTDIVERLREQVLLLEATGAEASDEIDRLRKALREIADAVSDYETADDRLLAGARVGAAWHNARAALGDGTP